MAIYVDADACPVKAEVERVALRHGLDVYLVSNSGMRPSRNPKVVSIMVAEGPDAADDWIVEHIGSGDVAVTSDIPLASRCLKKGARALGPAGGEFTANTIGMSLAMRDIMTYLRETGEVSSGGKSFSRRNRSMFLQELERLVRLAG